MTPIYALVQLIKSYIYIYDVLHTYTVECNYKNVGGCQFVKRIHKSLKI